MIIFLDHSLVAGLREDSLEREHVLAALSICAQQAREGNHIIISERQTFDQMLVHYSEMDSRTVATLRRASEKLTVRKQIRDFVVRAIRIVSSSVTPAPKRVLVNGRVEILVPAESVDTRSSIIGMPHLLVENINDGTVYIRLARSLAKQGLLPNSEWLQHISLRYEIAPGGGDTLYELFDLSQSNQRRVGLAIADGDYRYPGSDYGNTAKKLLRSAHSTLASPLLEAFILKVRTIENILPAEEIRDIMSEIDSTQLANFEDLYEEYHGTMVWRLVPMKAGVKCFELSQASAESKYWTSVCGERQCPNKERCMNKKECTKYMIKPISPQLLRKAAVREGEMKIAANCGKDLAEDWESIAVILYSFFCGEHRELGK